MTFSVPGDYLLRVTVSDNQGGSVSSDGSVTVMGGPTGPGDLDKNGAVNVDDLALVINHFGQTIGDPAWNPLADANHDGAVNITDLTEVTSNFGKKY